MLAPSRNYKSQILLLSGTVLKFGSCLNFSAVAPVCNVVFEFVNTSCLVATDSRCLLVTLFDVHLSISVMIELLHFNHYI